MKQFGLQVAKVMVAGVFATVLLSLIALVYEYTGVHIENPAMDTDYVWLPGQYKGNMTEGFSFLFMDENGYNNTTQNAKKAKQGIDILLMGSSHVEAVQVGKEENMGALLNTWLPEKNTYSIGISGHDLYRTIDNLPYALERFTPKEYVIMECFDVKLDAATMLQIIDGCGERLPSYHEGLVAKLQQIPAVKWIYKDLSTWNRLEKKQKRLAAQEKEEAKKADEEKTDQASAAKKEEKPDAKNALPEDYYDTLKKFLALGSEQCRQKGCIPIIFYHPTGMFYPNGTAYFQTDEDYFDAFKKACEENDIIFVDMTQRFLQEYEEKHIFPHGFSNTAVATGHLNQDGHRMIAQALTDVIKQEEEKNGTQ